MLTLPLYVDHSQLPSSPRLVKPLTAYLLAVWQCGQGRHDDCCNTLEMIDEPQLVPAVKFLLGNDHYSIHKSRLRKGI